MTSRLEDIRQNINHHYDEKYLKNILIDFHSQNLDNSNFYVENRNVSKLLNYFFDDLIYMAKSKNGTYSPKDIIDNDELLQSALQYIDTHKNFYQQKSDVANLRDFFFSSSMVGKVTNFNPVIARKIYERYVPFDNAVIFDYSCGFGSRMLGALSSKYNYSYIGVDPYEELYKRLLNFYEWIITTLNHDESAQIFNIGSEIFIPTLVNSVDLSFSSPPYFNYETYVADASQSYIQYPAYEEWLEEYVRETIRNLYEYTKQGGTHIVNLEDTRRIRIVDDWINIAQSIGFTLESIESISTLKRSSNKNENKLIIFKK